MLNEIEKQKIDRFLKDTIMSNAVKNVFINSFLKPIKSTDTNFLAASRIAIDLLNNAWDELQKFENIKSNDEPSKTGQIGL
jgi:hypothetical protein